MDIIQLSWWQLSIGFLILTIPAYILWKYKTGLNKKLAITTVRMTLQLLFVGYYLEYLFEYDNPWINIGWILIMVAVADFATIDRSELQRKKSLLVPILGLHCLALLSLTFFS